MLTASFRNIVLFIFSKYLVFAVVIATLDNRFKSLVTDRSKTMSEWIVNTFHYFMYVLLVIIVFIAIFCLPFYFLFKINNKSLFLLAMVSVLLLDSFCYVSFNAPGNLEFGAIDLLVGILMMLLFFFKPIRQKFIIHH